MTTFRATPKLSTRRLRRNWFSGFGWLWSADRLRWRGLSRWFSGFGWLWSADRLRQGGLSRWFSSFGWLWSADRLRRRGLSRWFSGFGWLWCADRLHRRGLSRLLNLWWHRCVPCGPTVGCRTKHPTISNNLPKLGNLNSAFKTVNCHFSFLLLDFGGPASAPSKNC